MEEGKQDPPQKAWNHERQRRKCINRSKKSISSQSVVGGQAIRASNQNKIAEIFIDPRVLEPEMQLWEHALIEH